MISAAPLQRASRGLVAFLALSATAGAAQAASVVVTWNEAALDEVRRAKFGPPVVARALAVAHTCMYDAWAPYDARAIGAESTSVPRRPNAEFNDANKAKAVSFAAYRCLVNLFPDGAGRLNATMRTLGYDPNDVSTNLATPQGIGNKVAADVIAARRNDGSNQYGDLAPGAYADYTGYASRNAPMPFCLPSTPAACALNVSNPFVWQPLINDLGVLQRFVAPQWERVTPFALSSADQFDARPEAAAGPRYLQSPALFQADIDEILANSAALDERRKLIVEYWADGPASELPPGHWGLFAQFVSRRDNYNIDRDVKMFFAMHNASFDAGIVAWHLKRKYDGVRPITAVRQFRQGQPVTAWGGPGQPVKTIDGGKWTPYNPGSNLTPAFPGWVSGHATFSAASAAVLRAFTGSDHFGFSTTVPPGFGRVEGGVPSVPTALSYPTFTAAANDAALSRLYAGIHFADDNTVGLALGDQVGKQAWARAQFLFDGGLSGASASVQASGFTSSLSWSHLVDGYSNRLLLVGVATTTGSNSATSVTVGGLPLTRLGYQLGPFGDNRVELWYRVAPPVGWSTVTVRMSQLNDVVAGATSYVGVNQSTPFGTFRSSAGSTSSTCITLANEPAPMVHTVMAANADAGAVSLGSGQTLMKWSGVSDKSLLGLLSFSDVLAMAASAKDAPPTARLCNNLSRGRNWSMLGVPLKPAVAP